MHTDRLKLVRSEGGVDYYIDTQDPHKAEFGIPRSAIRNAPAFFRSNIVPHTPSQADFSVRRLNATDGCYHVGGVNGGS